MDKIYIKNARLWSWLGITPEERFTAQEIFVDVTLHVKLNKVFQTDDIEDTVNYSEVYKTVAEVCSSMSGTIEFLAGKIADRVIDNFAVDQVDIIIRKPGALASKNVDYAAVEISRKVS